MNEGNGDSVWRNSAGQIHREDGPAIEGVSGYRAWWVNGELHRTGGPAIELVNGGKEWWVNDKLHRTDGPAVELVNGDKEWYFRGKSIDQTDFSKEISHLHFKFMMLSRVVNPFCEINVAKYCW